MDEESTGNVLHSSKSSEIKHKDLLNLDRTSRALHTSKSSETKASHLSVPVPPLFRSSRTNGDNSTNRNSAAALPLASDGSQSSPGNDEPKLRRTSKDASSTQQPSIEGLLTNDSAGSAKDDVVFSQSSLGSSSGHCLDSDVARLYMDESLRYQEDVDLREFSLFAGVDGLAASSQHRRQHHHRHHHHHHLHHHQQQHQQQQQHDDRPSRIPRPLAAGSRHDSVTMPFDTTFKPSPAPPTTTSAAVRPSTKQPPVTTTQSQPLQAAATQNDHATSVTKYSSTKGLEAEPNPAAAVSGKTSRSHQRSASTWETRRTLADLWTEFQKPTSFSTSS